MTDWNAETMREMFVEYVAGLPGMAGVKVEEVRYFILTTEVADRHADLGHVYGAEFDFLRDNPDLPAIEFRVVEKATGEPIAAGGIVEKDSYVQ